LSDAADAITTGPGVSYTACFIFFALFFMLYKTTKKKIKQCSSNFSLINK